MCLLTAFSERMRRVPVALPEMVRALSAHQQTLKQVCVCVGGVVRALVLGPWVGGGSGAAVGDGDVGWGSWSCPPEIRSGSVWPSGSVCAGVPVGTSIGPLYAAEVPECAHIWGARALAQPVTGAFGAGRGSAGARYRSLWLAKCFSAGLHVSVSLALPACVQVCTYLRAGPYLPYCCVCTSRCVWPWGHVTVCVRRPTERALGSAYRFAFACLHKHAPCSGFLLIFTCVPAYLCTCVCAGVCAPGCISLCSYLCRCVGPRHFVCSRVCVCTSRQPPGSWSVFLPGATVQRGGRVGELLGSGPAPCT